MEQFDKTPVAESENEDPTADLWEALDAINERLEVLEHRIATLDVRRVANENNQDDPEWY